MSGYTIETLGLFSPIGDRRTLHTAKEAPSLSLPATCGAAHPPPEVHHGDRQALRGLARLLHYAHLGPTPDTATGSRGGQADRRPCRPRRSPQSTPALPCGHLQRHLGWQLGETSGQREGQVPRTACAPAQAQPSEYTQNSCSENPAAPGSREPLLNL